MPLKLITAGFHRVRLIRSYTKCEALWNSIFSSLMVFLLCCMDTLGTFKTKRGLTVRVNVASAPEVDTRAQETA